MDSVPVPARLNGSFMETDDTIIAIVMDIILPIIIIHLILIAINQAVSSSLCIYWIGTLNVVFKWLTMIKLIILITIISPGANITYWLHVNATISVELENIAYY